MPLSGFRTHEIPVFAQVKIFHALDLADTVIGYVTTKRVNYVLVSDCGCLETATAQTTVFMEMQLRASLYPCCMHNENNNT
jgi:hypothetical protein